MQEKNILLCFLALPLRHKLIAAVIAVAISSGLFVWSRHGAARLSMTAEMLFDTVQSQQIDPNLSSTKEPAVTLGHSILNDDSIKGLMKRAGVHVDVTEFRSRLELTQQSPKSLNVKYQDNDKKLSVATANAVANLLVGWTPSPDVTVAKAVSVRPISTSVANPAETSHRAKHSLHSQSTQIRNLTTQLAATDQKLAALNSMTIQSATQKADKPEGTLSADGEQRHALEVQLYADQKKLDYLLVRYTDQYPDVENVKEDIAQIQEKLASIQSAGNREKKSAIPPSDNGSNDVNQLRLERTRLLQAIAGEQRRAAMRQGRVTTAGSLPAQSSIPFQLPPASAPKQISPVSSHPPQSPFTIIRLASFNPPVFWWHGLVAGMLCGLLYLTSAVWRYLPIDSAPEQSPLVPRNNLGADPVNSITDFHDWEKQIKQTLALTDIGRQEEALAACEEALVSHQQIDRGSGLKGQLLYDEISQAIQEKVKRDPNSWMAHTEEARSALAGGDYDTAIKEINLAITVAPEKLKPHLDKIIMRLDRNVSHS